jgi:hypothetical protein
MPSENAEGTPELKSALADVFLTGDFRDSDVARLVLADAGFGIRSKELGM